MFSAQCGRAPCRSGEAALGVLQAHADSFMNETNLGAPRARVLLAITLVTGMSSCGSSSPGTSTIGADGGGASAEASAPPSEGGAGDGASGPSGGTSVMGTVNGQTVSTNGVVATSSTSPLGSAIGIDIGDQSDLCTLLQDSETRAGMNVLALTVLVHGAEGVPPGTYKVTQAPNGVSAAFNSFDANCQNTETLASTGTITVTSVGSSINGSFDLTFLASHLSGTFEAPACANAGDPTKNCTQ